MKKTLIGGLSAALAGAAFALNGDGIEHYQDWQFNPVTVKDTNAWANVRGQMDFTRPMHGPWLTNPGYDTMTIGFITRVVCGAAVEYREKGTEKFVRQWNTSYGLIDYTDNVHVFFLKGLKPGTEYEYRLVDTMNSFETPYTEIAVGREIYTFRTLDPKRDSYRAWFTADFHGASRLVLDPMYERSGAASADLYFFLGDNVEDRFGSDPLYYITFGFMDDVCRLWGHSKPSVFVRGNHDLNGREFGQWKRFFPRADARNYYTVAQGPVLYVILDPNREWNNTAAAREQYEAYLQEQVAWFRELKKTDQWKQAKFRIVMSHYGTHYDGHDGIVGKYFDEFFNDTTDEGRVHLVMGGHEHRYMRHDPNSFVLKGMPNAPKRKMNVSDQYNYCQVILDQCEALTLDVSSDKLVFTSWNWHEQGKLNDKFEIRPDGSVKDLYDAVTKYEEKPALIKSGDTVAFLGDSITQMGTEKPWGYVNVVLKTLKDGGIDVKPVFAGVSGDSCRQMLARLEKDVLSKKPDWVIFSDGVNDPPNGGENKGVPLAEFKAKYTEIVEKILASGAKVAILGPTPVVEELEHVANRNQDDYAKFIRDFAAKRDLPFADMNGLFKTLIKAKADKKVREFTVDGTHLNERGNALFANEVVKALAKTTQADNKPVFVIDSLDNVGRYDGRRPQGGEEARHQGAR